MAAPFDLDRPTRVGSAVPLPLRTRVDVVRWGNARPQLAVSTHGILVFVPEPPGFMRESTFVWVDREGNAEEMATLPLREPWIDLTPDGQRVLVADMQSGEAVVQVLDLQRPTTLNTLARNRQLYQFGVTWSSDSSAVYASGEGGAIRIYEIVLGQDAPAEMLIGRDAKFLAPSAVSPDGKSLALMRYNKVTEGDIWILELDGDDKGALRPFSTDPDHEHSAVFSPDGRWIAYVAGTDLYVRRFPQGTDRTLVTQMADSPRWSPDGSELFYLESAPHGVRMNAVPIRTGQELQLGEPRPLFEGAYRRDLDEGHSYAVAPDGSRFLMIRHDDEDFAASELTVVMNWFEELESIAPSE
jgi:Tol biopolymer transport system component